MLSDNNTDDDEKLKLTGPLFLEFSFLRLLVDAYRLVQFFHPDGPNEQKTTNEPTTIIFGVEVNRRACTFRYY